MDIWARYLSKKSLRGVEGFGVGLVGGFGLVIGDAFGDDGGGDIEGGSDGGGASHVRNNWLAGEEAGDGEILITEAKAGFGAFAIEFGEVDAHVGVRRSTVGESLDLAAVAGEFGVAGIVAI